MFEKRLQNRLFLLAAALLVSLGLLVRSACAVTDEPLPRDPANLYGNFDNGVSYIIRQAPNPPGKVTLNLRVNTGALNETDAQNGLAHFLEHMAFKGSKHFMPMKLIPLLSHLGMSFGADTNAHTNLSETVFKLTMPDNKPQTIDTALTIFSDYASDLSLYPIQIESERRVILEEARTKKGATQRLSAQSRKLLFPGTQLALHDIIGDEGLIKTFHQSDFLDYWNTWYRPENMTLVIAGDIDPPAMVELARAKLGQFKSRAPGRTPNKSGIKPFDSARAFVLSDPEQVDAEISIESIDPARGPIQTYSSYRRQVIERIGEWIVNRRLGDRLAKGDAPYRSAEVGSSDLLHEAFDVSADASGQSQDWHPMLDALIGEIHQAVDGGFTSQELELAKRDLLGGGQWQIQKESTLDSKDLVAGLIAAVGAQDPILSAQQSLDLQKRVVSDLTLEEVQQAFKANFGTRNYAYVLTMPAPKPGETLPSNDQLLTAADAAWTKQPKAVDTAAPVMSLLATEPAPGLVVSKETDAQLGITTVVFSNGVVMHHKFLDSKKDQVVVSIKLPGGIIEETAGTHGLSSLASQILRRPATHRLDSTAINNLMTGVNVSVSGGIGLDAMSFEIAGSPADLKSGLELAAALLQDGVLEKPAVDEWRHSQLQALQLKKNSAKAQLSEALGQTVGGGDLRITPLTEDQINHLQPQAAQDWFERIARHSAIEVAVAGDVSLDSAIDLVGRYLGSLPARTGSFRDLDALRSIKRPVGPYAKTVLFPSITPMAVVAAGFVGCDDTNLDRRPLTIASMILTERMIQRIRIKDNLVYSIACASSPGQGISGLGQISASAPTDPKNADRLAATILELFHALADTGPTDQELITAKRQIANTLQTQMKEPGFWIAQLSALEYHRHSLAELRQVPGVFDTFTADQVRDTLRKYVSDDREIRVAAVPQSDAPAAEHAAAPGRAGPVD